MDDSYLVKHHLTEQPDLATPHPSLIQDPSSSAFIDEDVCWADLGVVRMAGLIGSGITLSHHATVSDHPVVAAQAKVPLGAGTPCIACVLDSVVDHTCGAASFGRWTVSMLT